MLELLHNIPEMQSCCVALGFFDAVHLGHEAVIRAAFCGNGTNVVLSVGDKGAANTLLLDRAERCIQLERLSAELYLKPDFSQIKGMSGEAFVRDILRDKLHAGRVACGENYRFGAGAACGPEDMHRLCRKYGMECEIVPLLVCDGVIISSTAIGAALYAGDIRGVNELLGRRYGYSLPVVNGKHLGRGMGTPTINQVLPEIQLPQFGVYASLTLADGHWYDSVTNVGVKPTVGSERPVSESWIRGFSGNLYGKTVRVELVDFIRTERRFDSLDELKVQIIHDGETALGITGEISQKLNQS